MQKKSMKSAYASFLHMLACKILASTLLFPGVILAQELAISAESASNGILRVSFMPSPPVHLSEGFEVRLPDGTPVDPADMPEPDVAEPFPAYSSPFMLEYPLPPGTPSPQSLLVTYQLCDREICHFPETREVLVFPQGAPVMSSEFVTSEHRNEDNTFPPQSNGLNIAASLNGYASPGQFLEFLKLENGTQTISSSGGWRVFLSDPGVFLREHGWALTVLAILLGGFLLNLTPCVLPMIPVNLAIIGAAASSGAPRRVRFALGLAYGAGMAAAYGGIGAAVVRAGGVFGAGPSGSAVFSVVMAVLLGALGLAMFGAWNLDFSRWRRASRLAGHARFPAAFLAGGLSALLAGACVAPVLVAVLALAGGLYAEGQTGALLLPFLLGVGMALPWPMAAAGFAVLPKPGVWMERVKKIFGGLILFLAVWYAWNAVSRALGCCSPAARGLGSPPGFAVVDFAEPDAPARLDALLSEASDDGRPVLLDFGARWCKVCVLMETTTLRDARVGAALEGFRPVAIVADDPGAPSTAPFLDRYGVHGYPAYRILLPDRRH